MKSLSTVFSVFSVWCVFNVTFWICLMCGVFCLSFFHGWWWHHTHPNRLHYSCIKSLKVDITFLRFSYFLLRPLSAEKKKNHTFWNGGTQDPIIQKCPVASGGLAWLTDDTRRSSSWIQTQMVCGLAFGNEKSFIFQSTILMFLSDGEQVFRQDKEERFRRLKEFITRIPGAVGLCLPCHWCDEDSWQRKLWSWAFESPSCWNFSWLDKPKTWCGDCQLRSISERINDVHPKIHPFWLFPRE